MLSRTNPLYLVHINIVSMNDNSHVYWKPRDFHYWIGLMETTLLPPLAHLILRMSWSWRLDSRRINGYEIPLQRKISISM
jgi:hypothetical protein